MAEKEKAKTNWGCLITILIVALILGGGGYFFYTRIFPVIQNQTKSKTTYTPPAINKENKDTVLNAKDYGQPIKDNEPAGRPDPFAPI